MAEQKYTARTTIRHNGKRYESGDEVPMEEIHAAPLLKSGALGKVKAAATTTQNKTSTKKPAEQTQPPADTKPSEGEGQ